VNKAFVKEPEQGASVCPRCGSPGTGVCPETLAAFVLPSHLPDIAKQAFFCGFSRCDVVYFDDFERVITTDQVVRPIWPKDGDAPICGCFGFNAAEVRRDVDEGAVGRTRQAVERGKSSEAQCLTRAADGRSCVAEIQRLYFKLKSGESR
jgi:hypothetical protein